MNLRLPGPYSRHNRSKLSCLKSPPLQESAGPQTAQCRVQKQQVSGGLQCSTDRQILANTVHLQNKGTRPDYVSLIQSPEAAFLGGSVHTGSTLIQSSSTFQSQPRHKFWDETPESRGLCLRSLVLSELIQPEETWAVPTPLKSLLK